MATQSKGRCEGHESNDPLRIPLLIMKKINDFLQEGFVISSESLILALGLYTCDIRQALQSLAICWMTERSLGLVNFWPTTSDDFFTIFPTFWWTDSVTTVNLGHFRLIFELTKCLDTDRWFLGYFRWTDSVTKGYLAAHP